MSRYGLLLRAMIVKEVRTTLRERHQLVGLIIALVVLGVMSGTVTQRIRSENNNGAAAVATPTTTPAASRPADASSPPAAAKRLWTRAEVMAVRWASIGIGVGVSLFFSLGYVMAATLATFAGEKDTKTLEILLASPISDSALFMGKCLSVLLPTWAVGYALLLLPASVGLVLLRHDLAKLPVAIPVYVLLLSVPLMLLIEASLVTVGAAISAKAETLKGASQIFGVIFFIIFFGGGYGLPLLIRSTGLRGPAIAFGRAWLQMPFAAQYGIVLVVLAIPAAVFLAIGRWLFQRDRLLT